MNHPCLVTLERDSAPRVLFSGDRLVEVDLPAGTRVIYPKPPMTPLRDPDAAIRYAINDQHALTAVAKGNVRGFSFIGNPADYEPLPNGGKRYKAIDPWLETTIAAYPVNEKAVVLAAQ